MRKGSDFKVSIDKKFINISIIKNNDTYAFSNLKMYFKQKYPNINEICYCQN